MHTCSHVLQSKLLIVGYHAYGFTFLVKASWLHLTQLQAKQEVQKKHPSKNYISNLTRFLPDQIHVQCV